MYQVYDLFTDAIVYSGSLIECYKYQPNYNSLLDFAICQDDRIIKVMFGLNKK